MWCIELLFTLNVWNDDMELTVLKMKRYVFSLCRGYGISIQFFNDTVNRQYKNKHRSIEFEWNEMTPDSGHPENNLYFVRALKSKQQHTHRKTDNFCTDFSIVSLSKPNWTITECCAFKKKSCAFVNVCVCVFKCLNVFVGILLFILILQFFSTNLLFVWMFPFFLVCSTFRQTHIDLYEAMICCWWCCFLPFYRIILLYCALYCIVMGWVFYLLK